MGASPEPSDRAPALYEGEALEGPRRMSPPRLPAAGGPIAPRISPSGECAPSFTSPDRVSEMPALVGDVASEWAPPAAPPDMVVDAFLPVDPASVVEPQPR